MNAEAIIEPRFIADANVGRLARWLRMMGYDTLLFNGADDSEMVITALKEERVILTRDRQIEQRRQAVQGRLKVLTFTTDNSEKQMIQLIRKYSLDPFYNPFSLCIECNIPLKCLEKEAVRIKVPPYVFKTQASFKLCSRCGRIYWQGTHWTQMLDKLKQLAQY